MWRCWWGKLYLDVQILSRRRKLGTKLLYCEGHAIDYAATSSLWASQQVPRIKSRNIWLSATVNFTFPCGCQKQNNCGFLPLRQRSVTDKDNIWRVVTAWLLNKCASSNSHSPADTVQHRAALRLHLLPVVASSF
jgi:hypothetical protein